MIEQVHRIDSAPRTSSAFAGTNGRVSAAASRTRAYHRVEMAMPGHALATALIVAEVSARMVDFDGLVWCEGTVLFEWIGSFSLSATPIQQQLEVALAQRLRAHRARAS